GPTSLGGVANAQALAAIYAASFGPVPELGIERGLLDPDTWAQVSRERVFGPDRISGQPQSFGLGFTKGTPGQEYGSIFAYGHNGANSSIAFADPAHKLAVAICRPGRKARPRTRPGSSSAERSARFCKRRRSNEVRGTG
ncbi:serine hydrolase, partial [Arthrobacter sp. JCM 19049]|uniref:serine hydrolase n=1 Tax=Arthrobacter sp. JCM 19049 TaxID=1460643 RepID=UPI000A9B2F8D